jgi:hypothetical protein
MGAGRRLIVEGSLFRRSVSENEKRAGFLSGSVPSFFAAFSASKLSSL